MEIKRSNHAKFPFACKNWLKNQSCKHGEGCWYLHLNFDCREFFFKGSCKKGDACLLCHKTTRHISPLRQRVIALEKEIFEKDSIISQLNDKISTVEGKKNLNTESRMDVQEYPKETQIGRAHV